MGILPLLGIRSTIRIDRIEDPFVCALIFTCTCFCILWCQSKFDVEYSKKIAMPSSVKVLGSITLPLYKVGLFIYFC